MESVSDAGVLVESAMEVNGKRPVSVREDGDGMECSAKKKIKGSNLGFHEDMKKVAEIVLVLSAMGKMRGGRSPSDVERELMEAARIRLAKVCQDFAPKDVFPIEAFGGMMEDLGLGKLKEQKLGFRPSKISIAEKLLVSKKKMEKADEFALTSSHSSHLRENAMPAGTSISDKANHLPVSGGSFQPSRISANSTSLSYQLPTSEIRPIPISGKAMPIDASHLRDRRFNVSSHPSQTQANHSANSVKTSTWKVQHHPAVPSNLGSGFVPQSASRTFAAQTVGGMQSQGVNPAQTFSLRNTHGEIVKIVQKLLRPQATESPIWDPPSRDYMNKALTCQICMSMATDVDSILICDACEKGYHYAKCLGMNEVPRVEWHCAKCLSLSNGKPLPPKYGRVMRNANTGKMMAPNSDTGPASSIIRSDTSEEKLSQSKSLVNGSLAMGSTVNAHQKISESSGDQKVLESRNTSMGTSHGLMKPSGPLDTSTPNSLSGTNVEVESDTKANSSADHVFEAASSKQPLDNHVMVLESNEFQQNDSFNSRDLVNDKELVQKFSPESISYSSGMNHDISSEYIHDNQWVGDPIKVSGENYFYASCFVNGHLYQTMDHALMRFNDKVIPAKIQAFWEDKNTAIKWVAANQCYFPDDFPESVGRPCGLENDEVCESTRSRSCLISSIDGPCLVLPPRKFAEENEKRAGLTDNANDLPPLYLCKWVYDEAKGLFRDASL